MNIKVRFLNESGNDLPGAMFFYARDPKGDKYAETQCAISRAKQKASAAGQRVLEIISHSDEVKVWVA